MNMQIETKYNIGDVIHRVYTAPADPVCGVYEDEHHYMGAHKIKSITTQTGSDGTIVCYSVIIKAVNGTDYTEPVREDDAFTTKEDALAEVKRRDMERYDDTSN